VRSGSPISTDPPTERVSPSVAVAVTRRKPGSFRSAENVATLEVVEQAL
jgi:hypothetical protein